MNTFSHVPPGFRFHPTDEELVDYYLRKKVNSGRIDLDVIKDVDLYKIEPWDLQELCRIGTEEQNEWYFFSHKDKKYPTGTRTNRATAAGFWKATGRDKAIYCKHDLIGMRKTLVFYKGRAPNGQKSDWIMHEYRLETEENGTPQEEGWVVCRAFKKRMTTMRKLNENEPSCWYDDQVQLMQDLDSPNQTTQADHDHFPYNLPRKKEMDISYPIPSHNDHFLQLPLLQSPKVFPSTNSSTSYGGVLDMNLENTNLQTSSLIQELHSLCTYNNINNNEQGMDQVTDWRVLDKFVASQLSQEDVPKKDGHYPINNIAREMRILGDFNKETIQENASTSSSSSQIEMWQ